MNVLVAIRVVKKMSKELEALNRITLHTEYNNDGSYDCLCFEDDFNLVDDALERLEEIEKVLEILKEKRVDLPYLRCCFEDNQNVERYNEYIRNKTMDYDHEEELTLEEFELLKRYCK